MRTARIKAQEAGYYRVMSRAIEGRFIFGQPEKERFHQIMRKLEGFCGLRIVTCSILSSHWHILLEVPQRAEVSDTELVRRIDRKKVGGAYLQPHCRATAERRRSSSLQLPWIRPGSSSDRRDRPASQRKPLFSGSFGMLRADSAFLRPVASSQPFRNE